MSHCLVMHAAFSVTCSWSNDTPMTKTSFPVHRLLPMGHSRWEPTHTLVAERPHRDDSEELKTQLKDVGMSKSTHCEAVVLIGLLNFFVPTDKSVRSLPTSKGVLLMLLWRCVEAAMILVLFAPYSDHQDDVAQIDPTDWTPIINKKAFNLKALTALCLSVASFACFLASAQYQIHVVRTSFCPSQRQWLRTQCLNMDIISGGEEETS